MGPALYRARNWKEAIAALEDAMKLSKGGNGYHWSCLALSAPASGQHHRGPQVVRQGHRVDG